MILDLFRRRGRKAAPLNPSARSASPQGPWTGALSDWSAREVAPRLYEALREAIPPIDAAINRLCTLDGILRVEAESDALEREIGEWLAGVPVNDLQRGLQAAYAGQSNEMYEQGFGVLEFEVAENGRDIVRLRVLDSKGIYLRRADTGLEIWYAPPARRPGRQDGTDQVERVLRNSYQAHSGQGVLRYLGEHGYRRLRTDRILHAALAVEADNPYGVSLLRSMEFCARVLLTLDNAVLQTWRRFGDPIFEVTYKAKRRLEPAELETRKQTLADNLARVLAIKAGGNSADFVNAIGADDELAIKVLGADGEVLEIEQPARHVLEQIVAKTGLPSWMLGFHWSTAERLAQRQGELVLQEARTRFAARKPGLVALVATMLRLRGRTWQAGDWDLVQELPSLQDLVAQAQARFLDAQTELMLATASRDPAAAPGEPVKVSRLGEVRWDAILESKGLTPGRKESWAEDDAQLPRLERNTATALVDAWQATGARLAKALDLPAGGKAAKAEGGEEALFTFDPSWLADLLELQADLIDEAGAITVEGLLAAWLRGTANAAAELGADRLSAGAREAQRAQLWAHGLELVRNITARALRDDILEPLQQGVYDGRNVYDVARELRRRFDAHDYDWVRLVRSEVTAAQAAGKLEQYRAHGVERYDYVTARDGKVSAICRQLATDGPYRVGQGPIPMRDSHPNCRCTIRAAD